MVLRNNLVKGSSMQGLRKLIIGVTFIVSSTFLLWSGIRSGADLVGLSTSLAAMSGGVFGIVWGNVKEHQNANK